MIRAEVFPGAPQVFGPGEGVRIGLPYKIHSEVSQAMDTIERLPRQVRNGSFADRQIRRPLRIPLVRQTRVPG